MERHRKTEEQYKDNIFNTYLKLQQETCRRDVLYGQFCMHLFHWCEDYRFRAKALWADYPIKKANLYGKEIGGVIGRFIKETNNVPKNKEEFFKYLNKSLKNAEFEHWRDNKDEIHVTRTQRKRIKQIDEIVVMLETILRRKLLEDEKVQKVSTWLGISKNIVKKYLNLDETKKVLSFQMEDHEGNTFESKIKSTQEDILDGIVKKQEVKDLKKAIESFLKKKQDRSRPCNKALITLYCVKVIKNPEDLFPILDNEILNSINKDKKIPNYSEIYLKYNPNSKNSDVSASALLREFRNYIKKNYPEISK